MPAGTWRLHPHDRAAYCSCGTPYVWDSAAAEPAVCPGMLRRNYRSHSALLALPNRLFYSQGLLPAADQQQVSPGAVTAHRLG